MTLSGSSWVLMPDTRGTTPPAIVPVETSSTAASSEQSSLTTPSPATTYSSSAAPLPTSSVGSNEASTIALHSAISWWTTPLPSASSLTLSQMVTKSNISVTSNTAVTPQMLTSTSPSHSSESGGSSSSTAFPHPLTSENRIPIGIIIGSVVGGLAFVVVIVLFLYKWRCRRRTSNANIPTTATANHHPIPSGFQVGIGSNFLSAIPGLTRTSDTNYSNLPDTPTNALSPVSPLQCVSRSLDLSASPRSPSLGPPTASVSPPPTFRSITPPYIVEVIEVPRGHVSLNARIVPRTERSGGDEMRWSHTRSLGNSEVSYETLPPYTSN